MCQAKTFTIVKDWKNIDISWDDIIKNLDVDALRAVKWQTWLTDDVVESLAKNFDDISEGITKAIFKNLDEVGEWIVKFIKLFAKLS